MTTEEIYSGWIHHLRNVTAATFASVFKFPEHIRWQSATGPLQLLLPLLRTIFPLQGELLLPQVLAWETHPQLLHKAFSICWSVSLPFLLCSRSQSVITWFIHGLQRLSVCASLRCKPGGDHACFCHNTVSLAACRVASWKHWRESWERLAKAPMLADWASKKVPRGHQWRWYVQEVRGSGVESNFHKAGMWLPLSSLCHDTFLDSFLLCPPRSEPPIWGMLLGCICQLLHLLQAPMCPHPVCPFVLNSLRSIWAKTQKLEEKKKTVNGSGNIFTLVLS